MNLIDVLIDSGGMFSSLSLIGMAFNLTFSYNLLLSSLIRKLYHFKPKFDSEVKKKKKKKDKNAPKTLADEEDHDDNQENKQDGGEYDGDESEDNEYQDAMRPYTQHLKQMKESSKRLFNSMQKTLGKGKANFVFKTSGILRMLVCCQIARNRNWLRNKSAKTR